jgi:drug/metabolite transporter (DMT)-like permease
VSRTGEKIFGLLAIVVGLGLAVLAGVEANIPPVALLLITLGVIGWVAYYFVVVRPASTGEKRPGRSPDRETE